MKTLRYPKEYDSIALSDRIGFTAANEIKILIGLARQTQGDIVEIGCSSGLTTRNLAHAFPEWTIHAVDWTENAHLNEMQTSEKPMVVAEVARDLKNVKTYDIDSHQFVYPPNIGFVFIDGDHSYQGVKGDTEIAVAYGQKQSLMIVWHDVNSVYYPCVTQYLDEINNSHYEIFAIESTMLAYCWMKPPCTTTSPNKP